MEAGTSTHRSGKVPDEAGPGPGPASAPDAPQHQHEYEEDQQDEGQQGQAQADGKRRSKLHDKALRLLRARQWLACIRLLTPVATASPPGTTQEPTSPAAAAATAGTSAVDVAVATAAPAAPAAPSSPAAPTSPATAMPAVPDATFTPHPADAASPAAQATSTGTDRTLMQMLALAWVHHYGARSEWRALLRLPAGDSGQGGQQLPGSSQPASGARDATAGAGAGQGGGGAVQAAQVRQQYRLMSTLVHPDKARGLPHASEAFMLLNQARQRLDGSDSGGKRKRGEEAAGAARNRGRRRPTPPGGGAGPSGAGSARGGATSPADSEADDSDGDEYGGGGGFAWWGNWDVPPGEADAFPSTEPTAADEADDALWEMPLQDLKQEVAVRQRLVFTPKGPDGLTIHDKQRRLRAARSVLAERVVEEQQRKLQQEQHQQRQQGGGFLRVGVAVPGRSFL